MWYVILNESLYATYDRTYEPGRKFQAVKNKSLHSGLLPYAVISVVRSQMSMLTYELSLAHFMPAYADRNVIDERV